MPRTPHLGPRDIMIRTLPYIDESTEITKVLELVRAKEK